MQSNPFLFGDLVGIHTEQELVSSYGETLKQIADGYYNINVDVSFSVIKKSCSDVVPGVQIPIKFLEHGSPHKAIIESIPKAPISRISAIANDKATLYFNPLCIDLCKVITNENFSMKLAKDDEKEKIKNNILSGDNYIVGCYFDRHKDWFNLGYVCEFFVGDKKYTPKIISIDVPHEQSLERAYGKFYVGFEFNECKADKTN